MKRQRVDFEPAYVLHARPFGDTSLLLEVFTAQYGRIGLIAKGARAPKSKKRALLQMLQPLLLSWRDSGELGTLMAVEAAAQPAPLAGEPLFCAWYANELLLKLCSRHDPHPELFLAYAALLLRLGDDTEAALRAFERVLLDALGYGLALDESLDARCSYQYQVGRSLLPMTSDVHGDEAFAGASLIALRDDALQTPQHYLDARRLLRLALQPLLNGRVLDSAKLLRELRGLERGSVKSVSPALSRPS